MVYNCSFPFTLYVFMSTTPNLHWKYLIHCSVNIIKNMIQNRAILRISSTKINIKLLVTHSSFHKFHSECVAILHNSVYNVNVTTSVAHAFSFLLGRQSRTLLWSKAHFSQLLLEILDHNRRNPLFLQLLQLMIRLTACRICHYHH